MADPTMQQYIQQIMDGLYPKLNDPNSGNWYLPQFIKSDNYDPYGPFNWNLGQLTDPGMLAAAAPICPSIDIVTSPCGTGSYITAAMPPNYPTLNIPTAMLGGLSNAVLERPIAQPPDGYVITARVDLGTLPNFAKAVTITGNWTFVNYCCCSTDGNTCSGPPQAETGEGTFTATMPDPNVASSNAAGYAAIQFTITNLSPGVLTLQVNSINFFPPTYSDGTPSMAVVIQITSIPKGANPQSYSDMATKGFNSAQARQSVISSINTTLNLPDNLSVISNLLTNVIDGYLQANHQYPFDGSSAAIA